MKIQVIGSGCAKCQLLESNTKEAVVILGLEAQVVKVSDIDEIMDMGVMITPALAIEGDVISSGKVLSPEQIVQLLKAAE